MFRSCEANSGTIQRKREMFKKAVQQGRRAFGARSVHGVREHAKSRRTQLAAFFNIPRKGSEDLATSSISTVDQANLGQAPIRLPIDPYPVIKNSSFYNYNKGAVAIALHGIRSQNNHLIVSNSIKKCIFFFSSQEVRWTEGIFEEC